MVCESRSVFLLDSFRLLALGISHSFVIVMIRENPLFAAACVSLAFSGSSLAWQPGTYPSAPARMHTSGFSVDLTDRNDVLSFWHAVYQASEGFDDRVAWTGDYSGSNGTVSREFVDDVERRLNYFRAMCGVPSNARVNSGSTVVLAPSDTFKSSGGTLKSSAAQDAALMLVRNYDPSTGLNPAMTHNPGNQLIGWSAAGWNASANGNFSFGFYGPTAITEYMLEQYTSDASLSAWNSLVGHRRWNLYPRATDYATGDQPGASAYLPPTNVFYVAQNPSEMAPVENDIFVAYPPAGYFPAPLNTPFWSLSRANANFSAATVRMTTVSGVEVPILSTEQGNDFGDPAFIWRVSSAASMQSVYGDTAFNVEISGISGPGVPTSHSYTVRLINPDRLTSNQKLTGVSQLSRKKTAVYTFTPPPRSEALRILVSSTSSEKWKENAETPSAVKVIDGTAANYPLISQTSSFAGFGGLTGAYAFRLTFPTAYDLLKRGVPDQIFELDRDIVPTSKGVLKFQYRRGYMTPSSRLAVEISTTNGLVWKKIGSEIEGLSNVYDAKLSTLSVPLAKSSKPVRIRFRYYSTGGSIYTHDAAPTFPTGIFLDEIAVGGCSLWAPMKTVSLSSDASSFKFSSSSIGSKPVAGSVWQLRMQANIGGKWMTPGTPRTITIKP